MVFVSLSIQGVTVQSLSDVWLFVSHDYWMPGFPVLH